MLDSTSSYRFVRSQIDRCCDRKGAGKEDPADTETPNSKSTRGKGSCSPGSDSSPETEKSRGRGNSCAGSRRVPELFFEGYRGPAFGQSAGECGRSRTDRGRHGSEEPLSHSRPGRDCGPGNNPGFSKPSPDECFELVQPAIVEDGSQPGE